MIHLEGTVLTLESDGKSTSIQLNIDASTLKALEKIQSDEPQRWEETIKKVLRLQAQGPNCITPANKLKPTIVNFLWEPYIPYSKITIIAGKPESRKTWLALEVVARCQEPSLYISTEDDLSDTLRPRAQSVGCDLDKLHLAGSIDLDEIESYIITHNLKLIVIDPISSYVGIGKARQKLTRLKALAETYGCAMVFIAHFTKGKAKDISSIRGSGELTAVARSIIIVERPDDVSVVHHSKSSCTTSGGDLSFSIIDSEIHWIEEDLDKEVSE